MPNWFYIFSSEILRTIDSLQLVDRVKVIATPANWTVSIYLNILLVLIINLLIISFMITAWH